MTAALSILAAVIGLAAMLIRRRLAQADDPVWQRKAKDEEIARDITKGDGVAAGGHLAGDLDELDRLLKRQSDPKR
jgi:hypothetical protein